MTGQVTETRASQVRFSVTLVDRSTKDIVPSILQQRGVWIVHFVGRSWNEVFGTTRKGEPPQSFGVPMSSTIFFRIKV